ERCEWLVHQQDLRVHDQRARKVHALLHAARQLVGIMMLEAREADHLDEMRRALLGFARADVEALQSVADIVEHRPPRSREASWNTTARSGPGFVTTRPSTRMRPALAAIKPSTTERNVVLPQPDGPTIDTNSPSMILRSTPSSATSRVLVRGWTYSSRMSCASSLAFIMRLLRSDWHTPDIHPALDSLHDLDQYHPGGDEGEHAGE